MYHGTKNGGFTIFDPKYSDDLISLFFTDDIQTASTYTLDDAADIGKTANELELPEGKPKFKRWLEGDTKKGKGQVGLYKTYLNLTNPLVVEGNGANWSNIPFRDSKHIEAYFRLNGDMVEISIKENGKDTSQKMTFKNDDALIDNVRSYFENTYNEAEGENAADRVAFLLEKGKTEARLVSFGWNAKKGENNSYTTRDIAKIAKEEGYDGVIFKDIHDTGMGDFGQILKPANIYIAFNSNQVKSVDNTEPTAHKDIRYSDRDPDAVSNRTLLANALERATTNDIERQKLREYKEQIETLDTNEKKLRELNEQIKELSFAKGPRDNKKLTDLRIEAKKTANRIDILDKKLFSLEAATPFKSVLDRERTAVRQRERKKSREALAAVYLLPIMILGVMLNRPLVGRFKEYSFEKYHNTDDHSSLI